MDQREREEFADRLCERYDEVFYFAMNSIIERLHDKPNAPDIDIQRTLGRLALPEQE